MKTLATPLLILSTLLFTPAMAQNLPKVVEGKSGWLYTNEELQRFPATQHVYDEQLSAIAQVTRLFREQGIVLAVAVVPTKASIYPEFLPSNLKATLDYRGNYGRVMTDLARLGVRTVNLKAPLTARKSEGLLFMKTDTHWSPLGMQVAAEAVAKALAQELLPLPEVSVTSERLPPLPGLMDLVRQLPPARQTAYMGETVSGLNLTVGGGGLLNNTSLPSVTLLGTSYSTTFDGHGLPPTYERIFGKALTIATRRDVLNFAVGAKGFWQPIADYAQSDEYRTQPSKLVVWEIPERYLSFEAPAQWAIPSFPWLESKLTRGKNDCVRSFATCNKNSSAMQYVLNWMRLDAVAGLGTYQDATEGFFEREGAIRHGGPDHSSLSFWLPSARQVMLSINMVTQVTGQRAQLLLNDRVVRSIVLTLNTPFEAQIPLTGKAGLNRLELRYANWNTKTSTFANGDLRKIAVTFSRLIIQR